jgi:hypothetical protein
MVGDFQAPDRRSNANPKVT